MRVHACVQGNQGQGLAVLCCAPFAPPKALLRGAALEVRDELAVQILLNQTEERTEPGVLGYLGLHLGRGAVDIERQVKVLCADTEDSAYLPDEIYLPLHILHLAVVLIPPDELRVLRTTHECSPASASNLIIPIDAE